MAVIEFVRGDGAYHNAYVPASDWSAGGKLFFAAKQVIDDDTTDAAAVIKQSWTDSVVSDVTINGTAYKKYTCYFPPSATSSINSEGAESLDFLGEFQYVPTSGIPITAPAKTKLTCTVYFDVNRRVT